MKAVEYIPGQTIKGIVFIEEIPPLVSPSRTTRKGLFKCNCGNCFAALFRSIITGNTTSCGCFGSESRSKRFKKHGLRQHELYSVWCSIKTRCYNKNRDDYKYYGGRGIVLSQEFHDFKVWFDYITALPNYEKRKFLNLTVDRINNDGNYERNNLRWATKKEQSNNTIKNGKSTDRL